MALGSTIRNRIVGFFVIISIVLIALPAMMDNDAERRQENNQAIAIDKNGAITDENGQLMSNFEPDYATLLEGDDGGSSTGELSLKGDALQTQPATPSATDGVLHASGSAGNGAHSSASSFVDSAAPVSGGGEVLIGSQAQKAPNNSSARPKVEVLGSKTPAQNTAQNKVEVLGKPANVSAKKESSSDKMAAGSFSVQVGVFSQKDNADRMIANLKAAGIKAFSRNVTINGKSMFRVYAGSGRSRDALKPTLEKVGKITGSKGSIVEVQ